MSSASSLDVTDQLYDVVIAGAGLVGLATALNLLVSRPGLRVAVLEKETGVARHQSGRNSGVIHSGIYYRPGTLKSRLCVSGRRKLMRYCDEHDIPYRQTGKLIVAVNPIEVERLDDLKQRADANGLHGVRILEAGEIRELEPNCTGIRGLYVPETSIVDYSQVAQVLSQDIQRRGACLALSHGVTAIKETGSGLTVMTTSGAIRGRGLINCSGLHSDIVAKMAGLHPTVEIVPFRGEYFHLRPERRQLVRGLIYPVPDPALPFLGVHFTQHMDGEVGAGPNAVLALAREGYAYADIDPRSLFAMLRSRIIRRMVARYWRIGLDELARSVSKALFVESLRKLVPVIKASDLLPGRPGVRGQAVDGEGRLVDDFVIERGARSMHVLNAPSPAATACLSIGEFVSKQAFAAFGLAG